MRRQLGSMIATTLVALSAGLVLGDAILREEFLQGMVGVAQFGMGILLACSLVREKQQLPAELLAELRERAAYEAAVQSAPRIGELLVYRYRWISEQELTQALAHQRCSQRRLGEILVRMGAIPATRLLTALVEQRQERGHLPVIPLREEAWTARREPRKET